MRKNIVGECNSRSTFPLTFAQASISYKCQELGVPFINISAPSIVSGMSGESEKTLRDTFEEAKVCSSSELFVRDLQLQALHISVSRHVFSLLMRSMPSLQKERAHKGKWNDESWPSF
jgi:SpoVK/Ycf46/Vps4 family AAA+-type ATPase